MKRFWYLITLTVMFVFLFSVAVMAEETPAPAVYTTKIVYHANGGVGDDVIKKVKSNTETYTISKNLYTRTGYTFVSWNTKADGSGQTYKAKADGTALISRDKTAKVNLYAQWKQNVLTIKFHSNYGTGTMAAQKVLSGSATSINTCTFTRTGYVFDHWNTSRTDDGTKFANNGSLASLTEGLATSQTIVLYAQWRLDAPVIKSAAMSDAKTILVKYDANPGAAGYQVFYSTTSSFPSATTKVVKVKAGTSSAKLPVDETGKKYYVRMRNYVLNSTGTVKIYSKYSKVFTITVSEAPSIENTDYFYAIECDVKLTGTGQGYHAKLVMGTETAAVSYGLQYDKYAASPYTKKTAMLIENVKKSSQKYTRPGNKIVDLNKTYHLMMVMDESGNGEVYLDYVKLGTFSNSELADKAITLRIEGACRVDGDSINAEFSNIKLKGNRTYNPAQSWGFNFHDTSYNGTYAKNSYNNNADKKPIIYNDTKINIKGTISLPAGKNWDDPGAYDHVSGVCQFYQR